MNKIFVCIPAIAILFLFQNALFAQGDLMIMPKRVVFDGSQRSQEVNLVNTGSDSATYAISFIQYTMKEDGSFQQIEKPEENQRFADDFLRYYPRRVSLAPNEAQTVRLQLTRTNSLETGEYRSHLYFRAVEDQTALGSEDKRDEEKNISINIKTVFGISIPVIIRKGKSDTEIKLTNLSLDTSGGGPTLSLDITRSGNMSVYGNLRVIYKDLKGNATQLNNIKGLAVYTPNTIRHFSFQLQNTEEIDLKNGKIRISYENDQERVFDKIDYELK